MDYIELGPTPCCEECAQLGTPGYRERALAECRAFKHQLIRAFGPPPPGARLSVKGSLYDSMETYYEVVVYFNPDDEQATDYALRLEADAPARWDEYALRELQDAMPQVR